MPDVIVVNQVCDPKTREGWLREEVKTHRTLLFSLIQWGMALLAAIESALYFIRRDVAQAMMNSQFAVPARVLSKRQWLYGTSVLLVVNVLFTVLMLNLLTRYVCYRKQLIVAAKQYSKIDDSPIRQKLMWIPIIFFWAFPIIDFAIWLGVHQ